MSSNTFKSKLLGKIQDLEFDSVDPTLSKDETYKIYKKTITRVFRYLKPFGFNLKGLVNIFRVQNEIYQGFNFQKSSYSSALTINTVIRPIFWHRPSDDYLLSTVRIGRIDKGFDKWYVINRDYEVLAEYLYHLISTKVLPVYDRCNSPKRILQIQEVLKNMSMYDEDVILFCALHSGEFELAQNLLEKIVATFESDERQIDWVIRERKMFRTLLKNVLQKDFKAIDNFLATNKSNFFEENPKIAEYVNVK